MPKIQSPLLGYNNNVRHKNRVFHIQTEDSGVKHPHIITHLFMDGGRILKSVKTSYAEHVGADGLSDIVRQMMKEQHKAMFIALRDGQFDHIVDPNEASVARPVPSGQPPAPAASAPPAAAPAQAPAAHAATAPTEEAASAPPVVPAPRLPTQPSRTPTLLGTQTIPAPPPEIEPPPMRRPEATIPDDVPRMGESVPPAAPLVAEPGPLAGAGLPPPPPALFAAKAVETGRYAKVPVRTEEEQATARTRRSVPPPQAPAQAAPPPADTTSPAPPPVEGGRYAPARPAAIFGQARPRQSSIFGEDLISDKSLDEVILSYLAEDLETEKK